MSAAFDESSLVSAGGLVPALTLAQRAGLAVLAEEHLSVPTDKGAHAGSKVAGLVAGMVAGADSIEDMGLVRHGGMGRLFTGTYAPSTLGSFLRAFAFGHVRKLDAVAARLIANLAGPTPLLPDAARIAYLDVDDTIRATYGYAKQGAGYGYSGVKGLNALIAALSTPSSAPVIVATRLRKGSANSARGAARLVADALKTSRACGAGGKGGLHAEDMPSNCALSSSGGYAVKHNEWAYFADTAERSGCNVNDVPMGTTSSGNLLNDINAGGLPVTGQMTPNLCNDAHDCSLATADNWLNLWVPKLMAGPDYLSGNLTIIITADEDDSTAANNVAFVVIDPRLSAKTVTSAANHYSLTRWLDANASAPLLRNAATAADLKSAFGL